MSIPRTALIVASLVTLALATRSQAADPEFEPPADARPSPTLALTSAKEPGQRMIVTGRLFAMDGTTPIPRRWIGVYHTDAKGDYGHDPRRHEWARLNGWLKTDSLGRFEIRTIRPGAYPQGNTPEHIHFVIQTPTCWNGNNELQFEDDRRVLKSVLERSRRDGRFGMARPVTRRDGVQRVERDLRVP
jgi:protocatechuate 3,4-dioxygenase, beta subunit